MKVAATCLALLCVVVAIVSTVRAELQEDLSDSESLDVEQFEVDNDALNLAKANLVLARNRCKNMGNCVHDRICDSTCKQWGYKDGECSGRSCICCA